jgi:hypothetical protein
MRRHPLITLPMVVHYYKRFPAEDYSMTGLLFETIQCPYCGESIDIAIDCSVGHQQYIEDCSVCCRPITITATASESGIDALSVHSEDE